MVAIFCFLCEQRKIDILLVEVNELEKAVILNEGSGKGPIRKKLEVVLNNSVTVIGRMTFQLVPKKQKTSSLDRLNEMIS